MSLRTLEQWHTLFTEHQQSGQTVAAFCRERSLCPKHFNKRRKELLNSDGVFCSNEPAFVPVTVSASVDGLRVELQLDDGLVLSLPSSISPAWLADLVHQLRP